MQLGKKSKSTNMFEQVRGEMGAEEEVAASAPLIAPTPMAPTARATAIAATTMQADREAIHVTIAESISAKLSRDGTLESFDIKGDLQLRITDASMAQVRLNLLAEEKSGVQFKTHPNVDRPLFASSRIIQPKDISRGFPANGASLAVMRWTYTAKAGEAADLPLTLTAWVNQGADDTYSVTVEYELTGNDTLKDVTVTMPYSVNEPTIPSYDAVYEVSGDSIDWNIGTINQDNSSGSFEFEAQADSDSAFFPLTVRFHKTRPFVDVDVSSRFSHTTNRFLTYFPAR